MACFMVSYCDIERHFEIRTLIFFMTAGESNCKVHKSWDLSPSKNHWMIERKDVDLADDVSVLIVP